MDNEERIADNLEREQMKRYRKSRQKDKFWENNGELVIFEHIKTLRERSKTYKDRS